jgi:phosphoribosylformimino-5-aminoimidazole carboxamide ribotide isomerase
MLSGVNVEATAKLARESGVKVVASGGVHSLQDIKELLWREAEGIEGCIIGKAIYTGAIDLKAALALAKGAAHAH